MPAGFASPGVLFAGNSTGLDRAFYRLVLGALRGRGYQRYVEVGVGAFAVPLVAQASGWPARLMETSDVTLYSSIVGCMLAGTDLRELGVHIDGQPVPLPDGSPPDQAAYLLWLQMLARYEAKAHIEYWRLVAEDVLVNADRHLAEIRRQLDGLAARIGGLAYWPLDMWDHIDRAADDPHAVILAAPPSYKGGFEKFFDTGGRLTWAEPSYRLFDPDVDMRRLAEQLADKPALLIFLQEGPSGRAAHERPVFAHPLGPGRTAYVISNRPDEVFEITGGPRIALRDLGELEPADVPPMPYDYQLTDGARLEVRAVSSSVADYYRNMWMHRLAAVPRGMNMLITVDGFAAGVFAYSIESMSRSYPNASKWERHIILRFAFGAPHAVYRLTRLATMVALQRRSIQLLETPANAIYLAASLGLVTVEYTRHPEAKGLRGLMRLAERSDHPDGFKLIYSAPWRDDTYPEALAGFLRKEQQWQDSRRTGSR